MRRLAGGWVGWRLSPAPGLVLQLGQEPRPGWITVGRRKLRVRPESLKGVERGEAWNRVVSMAPGYGLDRLKTDREIPILRLTPLD
jgi:hypothetical protein